LLEGRNRLTDSSFVLAQLGQLGVKALHRAAAELCGGRGGIDGGGGTRRGLYFLPLPLLACVRLRVFALHGRQLLPKAHDVRMAIGELRLRL